MTGIAGWLAIPVVQNTYNRKGKRLARREAGGSSHNRKREEGKIGEKVVVVEEVEVPALVLYHKTVECLCLYIKGERASER